MAGGASVNRAWQVLRGLVISWLCWAAWHHYHVSRIGLFGLDTFLIGTLSMQLIADYFIRHWTERAARWRETSEGWEELYRGRK